MNLYENIKSNLNEAELSPEKIVKDSWNHLTNDLGKEPTVDDVIDDITSNYDQNYFTDDTPEHAEQTRRDVQYILRNLGLSYFDESEDNSNDTFSVVMTIEIAPGKYETKIYDTYDNQEQATDKAGELRAQGIRCTVLRNSDDDYFDEAVDEFNNFADKEYPEEV